MEDGCVNKSKLATNKLKLLLNDLKVNGKAEKEEGKSYFTTELFAIRIKEILNILECEED